MARLLPAWVLFAVALVTAASLHLTAGPSHACSLGPFNVAFLGESQGVEVAAIGTLGEQHGAAIDLIVEEYYRAPASKASVLVIRNLLQTTTPSCEPVPTRIRAMEPGTRVIALLARDTDGLGADWRPLLVRGLIPIQEDSIESHEIGAERSAPVRVPMSDARAQLAKLGPLSIPNASAREAVPEPTRTIQCLSGPQTVAYLARTAPIIALGTVERANAFTAEVRVRSGFLGANDGQTLKIDNRLYQDSWSLGECDETAGRGPRFEVGQELLMFLQSQVPNDLAGYRGVGVGAAGIFYPTMPEPDRWQLPDGTRGGMSLEEAIVVIEGAVAGRPALVGPSPEPTQPPVTSEGELAGEDNSTSVWWLLVAATVAGAAGGAVAAIGLGQVRRSPR